MLASFFLSLRPLLPFQALAVPVLGTDENRGLPTPCMRCTQDKKILRAGFMNKQGGSFKVRNCASRAAYG